MSCDRLLPGLLPAGATVQSTHHMQLDPVPRLVAEARRFVQAHAPELPEDVGDALLLLTSELVSNAVLHASTPLEIGITVADDAVVVTVHDLDLVQPEQRPCGSREGGWGLGLVQALAEDSALVADPDGGKTAWFRLSRTSLPEVVEGAAARPTPPGGRR